VCQESQAHGHSKRPATPQQNAANHPNRRRCEVCYLHAPRESDNEKRSASLLLEAAEGMRLGTAVARTAELLVLATEHLTGKEPHTGDAAVISDIDLAILGAPRLRFDAYELAVRKEYAFVSEPD